MKIWQKNTIQKNTSTIKKYKLCGITILRKEKNTQKKKYNLLGLKISKKYKNRFFPAPIPSLPHPYKNIKEHILPLSTITNLIASPEIKIVSFDIFDTLLLRPAINPTDIFYLVAAKLKKTHNIDFIKYRLTAESQLNHPNATLDDIYEFIQKKHNLPHNLITIMKEEEKACEAQLLFRREDIYSIYRAAVSAGKKIIAVSDMYLPSSLLKEILSQNGYTEISHLYISCEQKCRKDDGRLYQRVINKERISPHQILHIGDNLHSDYLMAEKNNLTAIYYPSVKDTVFAADSIYNDIWHYQDTSPDPFCRLLLGFTLNTYFSNMSQIKNQPAVFADIKSLTQLAIAPLMFYLSSAIANNHEIQHNYNTILFASRDGYLPQTAYNIYTRYQKALPSKYIYAGRRAYFSTQCTDFASYIKTNDIGKTCSLKNIIDTFIFDSSLKDKLLQSFSKVELSLTIKDNKSQIVKLLKKHTKELNRYMTAHRRETLSYYQDIATPSSREIVFDCGYSGSISVALGKAMNKPVDKIYLWQTDTNRQRDIKNKTKTFTLMHEQELFTTSNIVYEELFSPYEGCCLGFKNRHPILESLPPNPIMKTDLTTIAQETATFMRRACQLFQPYLPYITIKDTCALQRLLTFGMTESPFNETALLKNICFADPIGLSHNKPLTQKIEDAQIYGSVFAHTGFENPLNKITPPAVIAQNNLKIAIHCHLYNTYLYQELLSYLKDFPAKFDLILTVCAAEKIPLLTTIFSSTCIKNLNRLIIEKVENKGRDVAPWLVTTQKHQENYDIFCHIHGKESRYCEYGEDWRKYLFDNLITPQAAAEIINIFNADKNIGCLFPAPYSKLKSMCINNKIDMFGIDNEIQTIDILCQKMHLSHMSKSDLLHSCGTMLWYRPPALKPLFDLNLSYADFPPEPIAVGGTIAHAIERLPAYVCKNNGFNAYMYNIKKE